MHQWFACAFSRFGAHEGLDFRVGLGVVGAAGEDKCDGGECAGNYIECGFGAEVVVNDCPRSGWPRMGVSVFFYFGGLKR